MPSSKKNNPSIYHESIQDSSCACLSQKGVLKKTACSESAMEKPKAHKQPKTRVLVQYDCGFGNSLYIRGEGISTLSWNSGIQMTNCGSSAWLWETDRPFSVAKFKILVNDSTFEQGENHSIAYGKETTVSPAF